MPVSDLKPDTSTNVSNPGRSPDQFLSFDLSGRVLAANSDLQGTTLASLLSGNAASAESLQRVMLACCLEKGTASAEVHGGTSDGALPLHLELFLLRDSKGLPVSILGVCRSRQKTEEFSRRASAGRNADSARSTQIRHVDGQEFIIASPIMHRFMGLVERVAGHTETVLITGETGVGKELIARTIHHSSHRKAKPLVDVNCAALPDNLVESELFGYEKGAFSGADSAKAGMFELADKGTLFLDEIGELPLHTQVKLLRVLDGQPFYRLGGSRKINVDVRVVAATNQDLEAAVEAGRFRRDLYHRLSQFHLRVPPLRERPEDVVALAESALASKVPARTLAPSSLQVLRAHSWPGNVRELRNLMTKACMESHETEVGSDHIMRLMPDLAASPVQQATAHTSNVDLGSMEEQTIRNALEQTGGHRTRAAEKLGISRRTLTRKLKEYKFDPQPGVASGLGSISTEQQKFFRARVDIPVSVCNKRGEQAQARATNLSSGGMGLDGVPASMRTAGEIEISFPLPDAEISIHTGARIVWIEGERIGIHFTRMAPAMYEHLQAWTRRKMKDEGWELPA